jgi:hypothetical protein
MSYHYYTFPHWTPAIYPSALVDPCGLTPDTIYIYGNPISPIDLPEHARCVHIIKTNRCNEGCYGTGGDRGLVLCSNHECWGHDTISSPACYTYLRLQPRQRYPESVEANFRAARRLLRETSESSQLAPVEEVRQQRNPPKEVFRQAAERDIGNILWSGTRAPVWAVDENEGPYVFRRPPRAPVEGLDDDQEILLDTVDEDVQAGLWEEATQEHSRVQHIPGEEAQEDLTAPLKRSQRLDEAEKEVQEINRFMDTLRLPRDAPIPASLKSKVEKIIAMYDEMDQGQTLENDNFIEEEEQKARGDRQFIAQKAACFAQEEDELTKQEDIYRIRDSVEDPQPPLATTYEGLAERDARIEARRRRVIAHQYRNSVVTSTMTPNVIDPSKTSLENPILNVAIDQFLAQDNAQLGKLDEKLTELSEIILSRSKKLGMASAGNYSTIRDHDHSNSTRFDEASTVADSDEETLTKCCVNCKDPSIDLEHPAQQLNGVVSSVKELKDKMVSMDSELACMTETLARAKKLAMAQEANITLVREAAQHRDEVLEEVAQRRKEIFKQLHRICNPELTTKAKGKPPVFNAVSVEDEVKHILRFTMPRPQEQEYTSSQPPKTEDPCVAVTGEAVAEKTKKVRFPDHDDTSTPPKYRGMGKKFSWMSAAAPRTTVVGPSGTQKASTARNLITTNTESADSVEPGTLDPETRSKVCKFSVEKKEEMLKTLRRLEELLMDSLNS